MKVLVACEESQRVCTAFRELGHEAYSCDIQECSGGHPEWHIQGDALPLINGRCTFVTMDWTLHEITGKWDLIIAHPPCTYLSAVTTRHLSLKCTSAEKVVDRLWKVSESAVFFMQFALADCERICVENPMGFMSKLWRKPDQTVHSYYFAESKDDIENYQKKRTCFWLKNLKPLKAINSLPPPEPYKYTTTGKAVYFTDNHGKIDGLNSDSNSAKARSKTFLGIARAMAEQWGK
ncbi:MAG: DNA cytosine methyltransferase [Ruminococcus sp.]|nr:DNA cytosine methyltransferase [Ruminococcus sp.]